MWRKGCSGDDALKSKPRLHSRLRRTRGNERVISERVISERVISEGD
jgi:hypothetical protein